MSLAAVNVIVLVVVFLFLALSPAPVTFPDHYGEIVLLLAGAAALLLANLGLAQLATVRDLPRGRRTVVESDPLMNLRQYERYHVWDRDGFIGVVAETLGDRQGRPMALVVADGWFGRRRFLVPLSDISGVDPAARELDVG